MPSLQHVQFGDGSTKAINMSGNRWYHITIGTYTTVKYLGECRVKFHRRKCAVEHNFNEKLIQAPVE